MCQTLRDSPARLPCMHATYSSYLLHTRGSLSTTGIEPDSVPTARLPESELEQCHTCSLRQVQAEEGGGGRRVVVGRHLAFPQIRLSFDYVTYGG